MARQSKISIHEDRIAIRALAILEEEGAIIEDDTSNINIDEGPIKRRIRHNNQAVLVSSRSRRNNNAIRRSSLNSKEQEKEERSNRSNISKAAVAVAAPPPPADDDDVVVDSCSTSHDGSSTGSCSYSCDEHREMGGKGRRRSHTRRSKRHPLVPQTSKKKPEGSSSTRNDINKLNVRFSKYDQIHHIPHINDMSQEEEINQRWMNKEDYDKIRSRSDKLIDMMDDPHKRYPISVDTMIMNNHLVCIRGLEGNSSHQQNERDQLHRRLQQAMFRIQQQQQEAGIIDPQAIRQVSTHYSKKSMKIAQFTGILDRVNNMSNRQLHITD